MKNKPRLSIDALIFSCNEILIDVSHSYREAVRKAVQLYLERAVGLNPSTESLITAEEVLLLQKVGQFTNYWDLTSAFVMYFIELLPPVPTPTFPSKFHVPALMAYLQFAGANLRLGMDKLREQRDIAGFAKQVAAAGGGLDGAHRALPKENRHLLICDGDIIKTNIVARIFQELYLGADLFEKTYGQPAIIIQSTGYAEHESRIIDPEVLTRLQQKLALGVVSDRPRHEVIRSLKAQQIDHYFQSIVTLDEILQAKANPVPDAWSLLEAARYLTPTPTHTAYVGANVGDVQAAKAANQIVPFSAVGCLIGAPDRADLSAAFEENKVDIILGHPNNLKELILG